jgi:hypothetical protein
VVISAPVVALNLAALLLIVLMLILMRRDRGFTQHSPSDRAGVAVEIAAVVVW